jgi:hypothetical protein
MADLALIKDFLVENGGVIAPGAVLEEEAYIPEEIEYSGSATNVEPVGTKYLEASDLSELRFFEDGIQRTLYVGHLIVRGFHIPVHYCTVAAVILERNNRRFGLAADLFRKREVLLLSRANVPSQESLKPLEEAGIEIVDTEDPGRNFNKLCRDAQYAAKQIRLDLEREVLALWSERVDDGSFCVVDGTVMNLRVEEALPRCLGVSKQVIERYFELQNHSRIHNLKFGERSWVFRFKTEEEDQRMGGRDRLSWYLRFATPKDDIPSLGCCDVRSARDMPTGQPRLPTGCPPACWLSATR